MHHYLEAMVIWQREVWWRSQWCYWDNYIEYWVRRQHQFKLHAWFLRWWWKGTWGILIIIVILIYLFIIYSHVWNLLIIYSMYLYLDLHVCLYISLLLWNVGPIQSYELKLNKFFWSPDSIIPFKKSNGLHHPFKKLQKVWAVV